MRSLKVAVVVLIAIALTACGSAGTSTQAPPAQAPEAVHDGYSFSGESEEPRTLEEAEAALERARAELSSVALAHQSAPGSAGAPDPARPSAPPAPSAAEAPRADVKPQSKEEGESEDEDEAAAKKRAVSPCETACKAFGSLLRARDAVCRLEAPRGARCERAQGIVRDAERRVQECACPR